ADKIPGPEPKDQEFLLGEGKLDFFEQDGKFILSQGEVAIDVTGILADVNPGLGRISLRIRQSNRKTCAMSNDSRDWLAREVQEPGPELEPDQEAGFTTVAGTPGSEDA